MLVPLPLLARKLGLSVEDLSAIIDRELFPVLRRREVQLYYQYLPEEMRLAAAKPPEESLILFGRKIKEERTEAQRRAQLFDEWHSFLVAKGAYDSEELWEEFCRLHQPRLGRGGKIVKWPAMRDWWRRYLEHGLLGLCFETAGKSLKGRTCLTAEQQALILAVLYNPNPLLRKPHLKAIDLRKLLMAKAAVPEEVPCLRTISSWIANWRKENRVLVETFENPDKARGSWSTKIGSYSEGVSRLGQLWELDGTKLDLLCADGKRYSVAVVIDVYSRRVKALVSLTSSAATLSKLVRDCVLDWGVPEEIVCDNGKDYVADDLMALWKNLGVHTEVLPPFFPQGKPHVESFNRKLARRAELWPGFVGHSVADRKAIDSRLAFADRIAGAVTVRGNFTAEEAQRRIDQWLQDEYHFEPHSALGCSPEEKAASYEGTVRRVDQRALDVLLEPIAGTRQYRSGFVSVNGGKYVPQPATDAPAQGENVIVRLGSDLGKVYLFDLQGKFICQAVDIDLLGADRAGVAAKIKEVTRERQAAAVADLRRQVRAQAKVDINEEITAAARLRRIAAEQAKEGASVIEHNFRQRSVNHTTEALVEASKIASVAEEKQPVIEPAPKDDPRCSFAPPLVKAGNYQPLWKVWKELDGLLKSGESLCEDALAFYANFQQTSFYKVMMRSKAA